jgi:hypothetical protein
MVAEGRLYPVAQKVLVRCPSACSVETDCSNQAGRFCVDGFCLDVQEGGSPDEACWAYGYEVCRPYSAENGDALGRSFETSEPVSFCRTSCADDSECGDGACVDLGDGGYCSFNLLGEFCTAPSDCGAGFTCTAIIGDASSRKFCEKTTNLDVVVGSLDFLSPLPPDGRNEAFRAVAMVMDNSGSLFGRGVAESDRTVKQSRATDPDSFRLAAAKAFILNLNNKGFSQNTVVSVWSFKGTSSVGVKPLTGLTDQDPVKPYVSDLGPRGPVSRALDGLNSAGDYGRSNVFVAIKTVAQNLTDNKIDPSVRLPTIIVFTDGPDDSVEWTPAAGNDDLRQQDARWDANLEAAVSAATSAGAQVFIIHLDAGIGPDGVGVLAPDPLNVRPYPIDADGRTGPISEYARIACDTGGQYLYVKDPRALHDMFEIMVYLLGGTWKIDISIDALPSVPSNGAYRLGASLTVNLDNRSESWSFSPLGRQTADGLIETDDSRPVVFRREGIEQSRPTPGVPEGVGGDEIEEGNTNNGGGE